MFCRRGTIEATLARCHAVQTGVQAGVTAGHGRQCQMLLWGRAGNELTSDHWRWCGKHEGCHGYKSAIIINRQAPGGAGARTNQKSRESLPEIPRESICPYGYDRSPILCNIDNTDKCTVMHLGYNNHTLITMWMEYSHRELSRRSIWHWQ